MRRGRAGQGMSINVIIIAAIALIILVILVVLVVNATGGLGTGSTGCEDVVPGAQCERDIGYGCPDGFTPHLTRYCESSFEGERLRCCVPVR